VVVVVVVVVVVMMMMMMVVVILIHDDDNNNNYNHNNVVNITNIELIMKNQSRSPGLVSRAPHLAGARDIGDDGQSHRRQLQL
jgi:hypothetical protein